MDKNNNINNNFRLPEGYFEKSKRNILLKIEWQEENDKYPTLLTIKGKHGFVLPEAYFENNADKLELIAYPNLNNLNRKNVFDVPSNYFESNKTVIKSIAQNKVNKGSAKIISLNKKTYWYAAAALLVLSFGAWIWNSYYKQNEMINGDCNTLACIEKRELLKYKLENLDSDELFEMVNANDLEKKLQEKELKDSTSTIDSIEIEDLTDFIE